MEMYDLIVLGGGPAGYHGAERAGHSGLRTALIEKNSLGGVCLNEGCIPSKAFLYSAKVLDTARHGGTYGVSVTGATLDHRLVVERKNRVVKQLTGGVAATLKKSNVTIIAGEGKILGRQNGAFCLSVNGQELAAKCLQISTGSVPTLPPIPGLNEALENGFALTNREILNIPEIPSRLVMIGGGVIGLEMASYFNSAGSQVAVIEMLDHIAGPTDGDIGRILLKNYQQKGVDFQLGSKVIAIKNGAVILESQGQQKELSADKVLLSIGRRAFTQNIGLENIGVYCENGAIVTDSRMLTNIPGVYAAGDVNGKSMLAHTAYREAEVAVNHMLGGNDQMRYNAVPSVIYTNPEVAGVGETEETARQNGYDFQTVTLPMSYAGRYLAETEKGDGVCKIVVDTKNDRLLGVHMIGSYASEIIYGAALMIEREMPLGDIRQLIFPHPTVSEIVREALFQI